MFDYVELVLVLGHFLTAVAGPYYVPSVAVRGVLLLGRRDPTELTDALGEVPHLKWEADIPVGVVLQDECG